MRKKLLAVLAMGVFVLGGAGILSATTITSTFTDLNPKIVGGAVEMFSDDALFNFTNQTGQAWSDFHLQVGLGPAGTQGLASFAVGSSGDYKGPGNSSVSRTDVPSPFFDTMDIIGLSIPNGGVYSFSVDIVAGESGWIMAAYPTVGGGPQPPNNVPEPATMLSLGGGLIGLAVYYRKRFLRVEK